MKSIGYLLTVELTDQEITLLKMLLNQHFHFVSFNYQGDKADAQEGKELVMSIFNKLGG